MLTRPRQFGFRAAVIHAGGACLLGSLLATGAAAERIEPLPKELEGVGVTEHLGARVPATLGFTDDRGRSVLLGEYFAGERPVLLTLNYSSCPMLCSLHLNGLVEGLSEMEWSVGEEFDIVTVSVDPTESTALARKTKQRYLQDYRRASADDGWHFLTGSARNIRALAEAVGFGYAYVEDRGEYAHSAVTHVVSPEGTLTRYLYGVLYDPQTIRLSLVEAAEGKIGSTIDRVLLFCFHYDSAKGKYGPAAENIMRVGGGLTVLVLGVFVAGLWRREARRRREVRTRNEEWIGA